jgi:hypothetical protein
VALALNAGHANDQRYLSLVDLALASDENVAWETGQAAIEVIALSAERVLGQTNLFLHVVVE